MLQLQENMVDVAIENLICEVVSKVKKADVRSITKLTGGVVNQVFLIETNSESLVIRLNENSLACFLKECWAMSLATAAGVRVPEIFHVGEIGSISYMLMEYTPGTMLRDFHGDRQTVFVELGRQAKLINSIEVDGFGFHLDWSRSVPVFTETWADSMRFEQEMIFGTNALVAMGALSHEQVLKVGEFLETMNRWRCRPRLCHGDLNSSNVLVQSCGAIVVLDWTQVKGGVAPFYDLAHLSMKDPLDYKALCLGYGLTEEQQTDYAADMQRVALKDVLRAAAWAYSVQHSLLPKFARDVQEICDKIFTMKY